MLASALARLLSQSYLASVPFLTIALAFTVGHTPPTRYLPLWLLHAALMSGAAWRLGAPAFTSPEASRRLFVLSAWLLLAPWLFISVFAGMGPPPDTVAGWVATAGEQQARYGLLLLSGLCAAGGFRLLSTYLRQHGEGLYAVLGETAIQVATPMFILNMAYWGSFLTEAFPQFGATVPRPGWYPPVRALFHTIGQVEVGLWYLATLLVAQSLRRVGLLSTAASRGHGGLSLLALVVSLLPASVPPVLAGASFGVSIPAIPLLLPYLLALTLLRQASSPQLDAGSGVTNSFVRARVAEHA